MTQIFGKNSSEQQGVMSAKERQVYCAICAGKHSEAKCPNKVYSKNQQLSSVRDRFAQATSFKQAGEYYNARENNYSSSRDNNRYYERRDYNSHNNNY